MRATNISALTCYNSWTAHNSMLSKSIERLSTGLRINSAADDAAGLAMGQRMEAEIRGTDQAIRNLEDGLSLLRTADSTIEEVQNVMHRMRELAVQAANGTLLEEDREYIQIEINELAEYVESLMTSSKFNKISIFQDSMMHYFKSSVISRIFTNEEDVETVTGTVKELLDQDLSMTEIYESVYHALRTHKRDESNPQVLYSDGRTISLQSGPNEGDQTVLDLGNLSNSILGIANLNLMDQEEAAKSITRVDQAMKGVAEQRASIGAQINSVESQISYLREKLLNETESKSRLTDADMAKEMVTFTKGQLLAQTSNLMMTHTMQLQQNILNLFKFNLNS